ncbi:MAG: glycosyltransferase family 2 protein [Chloroflexota bacterium]|nr:glycosyltransferase family 2 protein [Dehalococcoidia bacterium]MDW8252379.1 glycosyltransferase family 2 protein [Chloroflexota bacterium]
MGAPLNARPIRTQPVTPALSAIVLFWNGAPFVSACLTALLTQTLRDLEIIVVDNASTDDTAALIQRAYPQLPLLRTERNLGFAGGMNVGIRAARAPLVVLLNQDVVLDPDCLERVAAAFAEDARIGAVGAKLYFPDRLTLQHAGGYLDQPLALGHHYGYGEIDAGQHDTPRDVEYVTGAVLGVRRAALDEVGLLDEQFWPGYFEEVDLCRRLREAGWRVVYRPEAVAVHSESASLGRNSDRYYTAYHRGRLRYQLKHLATGQWRAFVAAEAARYPTLGSPREQAALTAVYRELASAVERLRPDVLPHYRRLLRLEPPPPPSRLAGHRRAFHPAHAHALNETLLPLLRGWSALGPASWRSARSLPERAFALARAASWLVVRWSMLPVLETFQAWQAEYEQLLTRLVALVDSLEAAFAALNDRDDRLEERLGELAAETARVRALLGELTRRGEESDAIVAALDRDLVQLRRSLALLQARLAARRHASPAVDGRVPAEEA